MKNNYQTPEVEIFEVRPQSGVCDLIPVSGPVEPDVKEWEPESENWSNIWDD